MGPFDPPAMLSTPPRLRYDSFSTKQRHLESIGLATPPLRPPGAVPFKWEEVPGKPKLLFGFSMHYHNYKMFSAATSESRTRRPLPSLLMLLPWRKGGGGRAAGPVEGVSVPSCNPDVGERSSCGGKRSFRCFLEEEMSDIEDDGDDHEEEEEEENMHVDVREIRNPNRMRPRKRGRGGLCMLAASVTTHIWGSISGGLKHGMMVILWKRTSHKERATSRATPTIHAHKSQVFSNARKTPLHSFLISSSPK